MMLMKPMETGKTRLSTVKEMSVDKFIGSYVFLVKYRIYWVASQICFINDASDISVVKPPT